jgi:hypothetical protein
MSDKTHTVSELYSAVVDWIIAQGAKSLKDYPGCWEGDNGPFHVAINGHKTAKQYSSGVQVKPYHILIELGGFPLAILWPSGGRVYGEFEDKLIEVFKAPAKGER